MCSFEDTWFSCQKYFLLTYTIYSYKWFRRKSYNPSKHESVNFKLYTITSVIQHKNIFIHCRKSRSIIFLRFVYKKVIRKSQFLCKMFFFKRNLPEVESVELCTAQIRTMATFWDCFFLLSLQLAVWTNPETKLWHECNITLIISKFDLQNHVGFVVIVFAFL